MNTTPPCSPQAPAAAQWKAMISSPMALFKLEALISIDSISIVVFHSKLIDSVVFDTLAGQPINEISGHLDKCHTNKQQYSFY